MLDDVVGSEIYEQWTTAMPPTVIRTGDGALGALELAPGKITIVAGAPASGKTALCLQLLIDAMRFNSELRVLVASVEMTPHSLLDRTLSRLSGIALSKIIYRRWNEADLPRVELARETMRAIMPRIKFIRKKYSIGYVDEQSEQFGAHVVWLDYLQRFDGVGTQPDMRSAMASVMSMARKIAGQSRAVLAVSAISRPKDVNEPAALSSLRESSELEFGADDVFMLSPDRTSDRIRLRHLKARHSQACDVEVRFNPVVQSFSNV
jgi:replicative DNA helicase